MRSMAEPPGNHRAGTGFWSGVGRLGRRLARWAAYVLVVVALGILFWLRHALYDHWSRFPRQAKALAALRAQRHSVASLPGWHEYRGILHAHSKLSHDCQVSFEDLQEVLKKTGIDFICLADHCRDGRADFDSQWRGLHDGKLFIPGFEMRDGFMPLGARPGTVLSNETDSATLARQIAQSGAVLFYAHPEEPREWDLPELSGMEIYNIHTDFKRYPGGIRGLLPEFLVNQARYPEQIFWRMFQRPTDFLRHWDQLNATRHITGIAGNDCHQNVGFRLVCTGPDSLRVEDTTPNFRRTVRLNWLTRPLASLLLGPLETDREVLHVQLDPYERMARVVNTHVLARDLSEEEILSALRAGRAFVGFDLLADSSGFSWWASNGTNNALPGESGTLSRTTTLHAWSPLPCRFTVFRDGLQVARGQGRQLDLAVTQAGKYRAEAELQVDAEWFPWVYVNPIQLQQ